MGLWITPSVSSVTGTSNRITSTGGSSPVIDISATFEALFPKLASANTFTTNGALSAPGNTFNGTWITGGTATTCKPYILIETTGATSTAWSTAGTGLGINAATGFTGNLIDAQLVGVSKFFVTSTGAATFTGAITASSGTSSFGTLSYGALQASSGTTTSNLWVIGTSNVGATQSTAQYLINSNNTQFRVVFRGSSSTVATAGNDVWAVLIGNNTYTEATSGTCALGGGLAVVTQTFTNGSGATTDFQNVYIGDAPTGGTNNWSLNAGASQFRGSVTLSPAGSRLLIIEGSNGIVGQTTLVSGTKAITITGTTTSSRAFVTLVTPSGTSLTTTYQAVCTSNTLTIQANIAAGTINASDASVLNYFVIN